MSGPEDQIEEKTSGGRRHSRGLFFHWLIGLFGLGTGMLAFLLLSTGDVGWTTPLVILLLLFFVAGVGALIAALVISVTRKPGRKSTRP